MGGLYLRVLATFKAHGLWRWTIVGAVGVVIVLQFLGFNLTSEAFGLQSLVLVGSTMTYFGLIVGGKALLGGGVTSRYLTSSLTSLLIYLALGMTLLWALSKLVDMEYLPALDEKWTSILSALVSVGVVKYSQTEAKKRLQGGANISLLRKVLDTVTPGLTLVGKSGGKSGKPTSPRRYDSASSAEPAPPAVTEGKQSPHWGSIFAELRGANDALRLKHLESLHRLFYVAEANCDADGASAIQRTVQQECMRLAVDAAAERCNTDEDVIDGIASLLDYGFHKLPELFDINYSDLLLFKVMHDINARSTSQRKIFVDHRQLRAFHPIDHAPAVAKCEKRAACARRALPALRANGMKLSNALIMANDDLSVFRSLTGFQVVKMNDGVYVTFEGNGRREALARAFGGKAAKEGVQIEVTLFEFDDDNARKECVQGVEKVRSLKHVVDT